MTRNRSIRSLLAAAVLVSAGAGLHVASANLPTCAVPELFAQPFSGHGQNTISWDQPFDDTEGGGYRLQVALHAVYNSDGSFQGMVDGEPNIIASPEIAASARSYKVDGLEERTHHYHLRVLARSGVCAAPAEAFSNTVTTTQDHSPPTVEITTPSLDVFIGDVVIEGTAEDEPGPNVATASGAAAVEVHLDNTTPVLGALRSPVKPVTVPVLEDGTWVAVLEDVPAGTYRAVATAIDLVGNESEAEAQISPLIVVN